jgi:hypothetical protein
MTWRRITMGVLGLLAIAVVTSACTDVSELVIHNRMDAPIVFLNLRGEEQYVGPCATETFRWDGAWVDRTPAGPIPGAFEVDINAAPPVDATSDFVLYVESGNTFQLDPAAALPPCAGSASESSPPSER